MGPAEALLLETFGSPFLAYVCATGEATLLARLEGAGGLPPQAEATFQGLVPIAEHVAEEAAKHSFGSASFYLQMLRFPSESTVGVWNDLRSAAGGPLPEPPEISDDELASILLQLALVQYPSYLLPEDRDDPFGSRRNFNLLTHPFQSRLVRLIDADDSLSRLFTDDDPGLGRQGFVYTSVGQGFGLQSMMLGEMLLRAAWDAASMSLLEPTFESFGAEVLQTLEVARSAARGDSTHVRTLVAFTGVTAGGAEISTPWGDLRPLTEAEKRAAPSSLSGAVTGTDTEGNQTTVWYAGELVLETQLRYSILAQPVGQVDPTTWEWPELPGADDLRHRLEAIQLSTLFTVATPPGSVVIARPAWVWTADPLTHGGRVRSWDVRSGTSFTPYQLRPTDRGEISRWCERIDEYRTPAVDIGIRRVLAVAEARTDPADRLVDSVIAWENLFGTRGGEVTLRLTLALAWLLEPESASSRETLQRRLKDLYRARSDIVHGNPFDTRHVAELANEAFAYAVNALAALFGERQDLLLLPDGAARSLRLMLGGQTETPGKDEH